LRIYTIPKSLIKFGEKNLIAVRVTDHGGGGGIWEGPIEIKTGFSETFNLDDF